MSEELNMMYLFTTLNEFASYALFQFDKVLATSYNMPFHVNA